MEKLLIFIGVETEINLNLDLRSNPASKEKFKFLKILMQKKGWWRKVLKFIVPSIQIRQIIRNQIRRANLKEFKKETEVNIIASSESQNFNNIPNNIHLTFKQLS